MQEVTNSTEQKHYYAKYGNEEYSFSICLYNNEGYVMFLQRNVVLHLEITDNLFNPFHSAVIVIANDQNVLEKAPEPYVFLGNGRDIVDLEIVPIHTGNFDKDSKNEKNKENLGLKFQFVIIECEDMINNGTTCKKLTLVEYAQYMLSENICNIFGLQKAGGLAANYMETNAGNGKPTGEVIKSIIYAVYNDNNPTDDLFYVDPDTKEKIFDEEGDITVTLNPYGTISYSEVLNYVLSFHSYKKSPCILQFDRYQKKFQLISLQRLFNDHTKYVIEKLKFPSPSKEKTDTSTEQGNPERSSIIWDTFPVTFEESKISQFYVNSPTTKYNVDLSGNSGVLSNSRSFKSIVFNLTTLNSESFMKTFYDLFVLPFEKTFKGNAGKNLVAYPNFYPNPNKVNNYNDFKGYLSPALDEKKFLNQKLSSLLYLNNVYQFKLTGKTHRKSLAFVDVTKTAECKNGRYVPTKWDLNTLGRHLITNVKHVFTFDTYYNEVETIKPYRLVDGADSNNVSLKDFLKLGV
jgi:hypothetical protein